jgi:hypothetical protein
MSKIGAGSCWAARPKRSADALAQNLLAFATLYPENADILREASRMLTRQAATIALVKHALQ